jgi:hypothetical protein
MRPLLDERGHAASNNAPRSVSRAKDSHGQSEPQWVEVVELWLRWNDAYERSTEALYAGRTDLRCIEIELDLVDEQRRRAIETSRQLLRDYEAARPLA